MADVIVSLRVYAAHRQLDVKCRALANSRAVRRMRPPCSSTRWRQIANPSPNPPWRRSVPASAWLKRSNRCGRNSGAMPMPLSETVTSMCELTRSNRTSTRPPFSENLIAFEQRFHRICRRRSGSPDTRVPRGSTMTSRRMCLASAAGCAVSTASRTMADISTGWTFSRTLPETIRDTSSTSSIICVNDEAFLTIVSTAARCLSGVAAPPASSVRIPQSR